MKITVAGTGYVGLSISILLAQHNDVIACDIMQNKVDLINNKKSPIVDKEISEYLANKPLNLTATCDANVAYNNPDFVVIATPTNYDSEKNFFDTSSIEAVLKIVEEKCPETTVVIKSTIPVGYTEGIAKQFKRDPLAIGRGYNPQSIRIWFFEIIVISLAVKFIKLLYL